MQAGDEVVYLREGHAQYLQNTNDKRQPPWQVRRRQEGRGAPVELGRWLGAALELTPSIEPFTAPSCTA